MTRRKSFLAPHYNQVPTKRVRRLKQSKQQARQAIIAKIKSGAYQLEETACLCGSSDFDTISNYDRDYLPVGIGLCRRCGMMLQSPRLTQASLIDFYENEYREMYNPGMRGNTKIYKSSISASLPVHQKIMGMMNTTPELVFEVGMHYGALLNAFKCNGSEVAGVDYDPVGLEFARNELGMTAMPGTSSKLLELGRQADLLMYIHVLEHINDLDEEFEVMRRLVKDGGHIYLSVPGAVYWPQHKDNDILCTLQLAHSYYFSLAHLTYAAARHGFELVSGDNKVDALFRKSPSPDLDPKVPDEYSRVKRELKAIHRAWRRQRFGRKIKQFFHL